MKSNYQDFQRYAEVDLAIGGRRGGDAAVADRSREDASSPTIASARSRIAARRLAAAHQQAMQARVKRPPTAGTPARSATARLSAEIWAQIKNEDWSLVSNCQFVSRWPLRLWDFDKYYQYIGGAGGYGVGYGAPAAVGRRAGQSQARPPDRQHSERRRPDVRARRAVDRRASPHSAAHRHAQQSRLSSGADAGADHGRSPQPRHHRTPASAPRSSIRPSTTPSSRRAWACTPKAPSPIRRISRRRFAARSRSSRAAIRRWSTCSRSRAKEKW